VPWLLGLACGCSDPTKPCGTFSFNGSGVGGADIQTTFVFDPSKCKNACTCVVINYIQIVRVIDRGTGEFLVASNEAMPRLVIGKSIALNGWAVDQVDSPWAWGWYGYNGDVNDPGYVTEGMNLSPAILRDRPDWTGHDVWFEAVDVPVCLDPQSPCQNYLLGYYYWSFIGNYGSISTPSGEIAVEWMQDAVDAAVAQWNSTAPNLKANPFPNLKRMQ
jgi:hypothetical protein